MTKSKTVEEVPCSCGGITHVACSWRGPRTETVLIEYMPEHLRASHEAAGNAGVYPHNGAVRIRVSRDCADGLIDDDEEWITRVH